ncbi:MAG: glycosyltransferase family 2 protein [Bacteroidetes bacterium]|nr:glycosyltransferase family 2 protein [Bacteroidota bacterium]
MTPKVSIIILNWNGLADTIECLESLSKIDYPNYDVIVVDNNSYNDDAKIIHERFGNFIKQIITNKRNLGFSGGNNVGIQYALQNGATFILLLNNDTIVEPNFLSELVKKSTLSPTIGMLTPMIKYFSDKNLIWAAGGYISKIRASGFAFGNNKTENLFEEDKYCTFGSGCCLLINCDVIRKVGLLDEKYFLYLEDTDYSKRVIDSGYRILYAGSSVIYHKVGATTSSKDKLLPTYYSIRNRLYFAKKNFPLTYVLTILYLMTAFIFKSLFRKRNKVKTIKVVYSAFSDHFKNRLGQKQ